MTPDQEERLVVAFESAAVSLNDIAASVDLLAMTADAKLTAEHPPRPEKPRDIDKTKLKTEEDLIREEHGGEDSQEPISRWTTIGSREQEFDSRRATAEGVAHESPSPTRTPRPGAGKIQD